ncbi:unnamed protein product [Echinostoma caproni]|uniref:BZIP domain-containing protein n=1 Tax=Echinostoma caproni TaxID=27848 RepID=A0A183A5R4_9TREM|nr:unnamed protein product [Echinostoma caproni]
MNAQGGSTEEREASDIYETPYASVTVSEEPGTVNGDPKQTRPTDTKAPCRPESVGANGNKPGGSDQRHDYTQMQPIDWFRQDPHFFQLSGPPVATPSGFVGPGGSAQYTSLLHAFDRFDLGYHYSQMPLYTSAQNPHPQMRIPCSRDEPTGATNVMEWVVKKRPDGSRYITRRPIRNRLLKERARRVAEERSGLTTDDDATSELKVGRYWNRTERRKQLEKARAERKKRQTAVVAPNNARPHQPGQTSKAPGPVHSGQASDLITMTTV